MMVEQLRRNINRNVENLVNLQNQLSSGRRLTKPSDDPQALSQAMKLKASLDQGNQFLRNINSVKGWLSATDTALDQLSSVLVRARDLALRGSSDTLGADERKLLAAQVGSLLQEALQAVNATHEGSYIFSGYRVKTAPFPDAVTPYQGDGGLMRREIDSSVVLDVNLPGNVQVQGVEVLPTALAALRNLQDHLNANDSAALGGDVDQLSQSVGQVLDLRGIVGVGVNRVDATEKALNMEQIDLAMLLSRAQDADMAEVMTKLMTQEGVYRAALAAGARVMQPSLLDFLE